MKALLLLTMFSFSTMAFSATKEEIVEALRVSLEAKDLNCKNSLGQEYEASEFDFSAFLDNELKISSESQPVFTFVFNNGKVEYKTEFITDSTNTYVTKIVFNSYTISSVKKNTGTLLNPVFEFVEVKKVVSSAICE